MLQEVEHLNQIARLPPAMNDERIDHDVTSFGLHKDMVQHV